MWSHTDQMFLKSLRITSTDPPTPLPRFRVEPGPLAGRYWVVDARVIDKKRRPKVRHGYGPDTHPDPRGAAEAKAEELNSKHVGGNK